MRNGSIWSAMLMVAALGCSNPNEPAVPGAATSATTTMKLYLDTHELGKVSAKDVAEAHKKDVALQAKYGVTYKAYWVDEEGGMVYCLVEAPSAEAAVRVHAEGHGLIAKSIVEVIADNLTWSPTPGVPLFLDVHHLGKGNVTPEALAEAHKQDLAAQDRHGVKYLDYWLDQETGTVWCLVEAPNAEEAIAVHREAHGLVPDSIARVTEGR